MRLDAERTRGPPLLCHFSRSRDGGRRGGSRRHELAGSEKSSKHRQSQKKGGIHDDSPVLSVRRDLRPRAGPQRTQREPGRAVIMSPLSVRAVRTFGECQQPELRGEPEEGVLSITTQSNQSRVISAPRNFSLVPPGMGAARAALCGKSKAGD